VEVQSSEVR